MKSGFFAIIIDTRLQYLVLEEGDVVGGEGSEDGAVDFELVDDGGATLVGDVADVSYVRMLLM